MKFLIVDDSATMCRILCNSLKRIGYDQWETALDGEAGLYLLGIEDIDFIIVDWTMPGMSGLKFVKAVRKVNTSIPILLVVTRSIREDILLAGQAGVDNYVIKPFTPIVLRDKIDQILTAKVVR